MNEECEWKSDDDGVWNTSCGEAFVFNDGTPTDNSMRFCPYCGKKLREAQAPDQQ